MTKTAPINKSINYYGLIRSKRTQNTLSNQLSYTFVSWLLVLTTLAYLICEVFFESTYIDELLGCISLLYLILFFFKNPSKLATFKISFILFIVFFVITLISSIRSKLAAAYTSSIDMVANFKCFTIFFALICVFDNKKVKKKYISIMLPLAKIFIISALFCCILSQFVDISMRGANRYGIYSFNFIFSFAHQFYYATFFMVAILLEGLHRKNQKIFYMVLSSILFISTLKGPPLIFVPVFWILALYFKKNTKLHVWILLLVFSFVVLIGNFQITNYLMNVNAPRYVFYKYGFYTAVSYFPFGSGFATFGSDMAARFYSPLYLLYGFNERPGLTIDDGSFLSDVGWAKFLAQSGLIGFIFFVAFYISLIFLYKKKNDYISKSFYYSLFLILAIHAVGSSTFSNSSGIAGLSALAILATDNGKKS
jgi:hypothetical protein